MESKLQRISSYSLSEIRKYGKEVEATTVDASIRYVLSELKRLRNNE